MKKRKIDLRILSLAVAVSMTTVFAGCGNNQEDSESWNAQVIDIVPSLSDDVPIVTKSENGIDDGVVYIPSYEGLSIPDGSDSTSSIYIDGYEYIDDDDYEVGMCVTNYGYDTSDEAIEAAYKAFLRPHFDLEEVSRAITLGDVVDYTYTTSENQEVTEDSIDTCGADYDDGTLGVLYPTDENILDYNSEALVEAMIGKSAGDSFTVTLDGKEFNITIDTVSTYKEPEITDEWVAAISDYDTVEAYKEAFVKQYKDGVNKAKLDYDRENILSALGEKTQLLVSESSLKDEFTESYNSIVYDCEISFKCSAYDSIDEYFTGETEYKDVNEFCDWAKEEAFKNVKKAHAIDIIFDDQQMTVSEDEVREAIKSDLGGDYDAELESEYKEILKEQKVADFLLESANIISDDVSK